jgi:hypothetical protein
MTGVASAPLAFGPLAPGRASSATVYAQSYRYAVVPAMATTDETHENDETHVDPEPGTGNTYLRDLFKLVPQDVLPDPGALLPG